MADDLHQSTHHKVGSESRAESIVSRGRGVTAFPTPNTPHRMLGTGRLLTLMVGIVGRHVLDLPLLESGILSFLRPFRYFFNGTTRHLRDGMTCGRLPASALLDCYPHPAYHHRHRQTNKHSERGRKTAPESRNWVSDFPNPVVRPRLRGQIRAFEGQN
jgi:hypothetical protein